jgi:hypothetical protein
MTLKLEDMRDRMIKLDAENKSLLLQVDTEVNSWQTKELTTKLDELKKREKLYTPKDYENATAQKKQEVARQASELKSKKTGEVTPRIEANASQIASLAAAQKELETELYSRSFDLTTSQVAVSLDEYDASQTRFPMHVKIAQFNQKAIDVDYRINSSSDLGPDENAALAEKVPSKKYVAKVVYRIEYTGSAQKYRAIITSVTVSELTEQKDLKEVASLKNLTVLGKEFLAGKLGVGGTAGDRLPFTGPVVAAPAPQPAPVARLAPVAAVRDDGQKKVGLPIALNIFPGFGLGSYIEGDVLGGLIGTGGSLLGYVFLLNSFSAEDATPVVLWLATGAATITYGVIRPISFAKKYNEAHGFSSIDLLPTISATSVGGNIVAAPGAILKLSF